MAPASAHPAAGPPRSTWGNTWRFVVGGGICLVIGWFAFVRSQPVPILSGVDLAFHEASHFLTMWLPQVLYFAAGSVGQVLWPLGIGIAFLVVNKDLLGAGLCFAWAGAAAQNVSVYVADAPTMALPLIGGLHDWNTILGPDHLDALGAASGLARFVWVLGLGMWLAGLGMCCWGPFVMRARSRREAASAATAASATDAAAGRSSGSWAVTPPWESPPPSAEDEDEEGVGSVPSSP